MREMYNVEVSPEFISSVTATVMSVITTWQAKPLEPMYPVAFFDALRVKIREDAVVRNKAVYLALGVLADGTRDIIESVHARLRKIIKTRGQFPSDDDATKLIWLAALRNITAQWSRAAHDWKQAMNQFAIMYPDTDRFNLRA